MHQDISYNFRFVLTFVLNSSSEIISTCLTIFKLLTFTLFFFSWSMPILFNKKASWTLDAKENLIAIVAMFLKFTVDIFPLFNFVLGLAF